MGREHWVETLLHNVAVIIMGQSPPSSTYNDKKIGLPFFQGKAEFDETSPIINKYCSQPVRIAEPNDILLSVRAPVGPTNLANTKCCIGRGLAAIRPINGFSISFLLRYFKHIEPWFSKEGTGSTFTAIKKDTLTNLEIPLPPHKEQKRIVEKLDAILPKVKSAKTRLEKIPAILKKFRQSVLAAACSGRLTEDWREGKDLPEWTKAKLKDVGSIGRGKSKHRPRNALRLFNGKYPFIQTGDVAQSNGYISSYSQTYNETGLAQSKLWPENTLCITIAANIANTGILTFPACFPDSIVGFIPDKKKSELLFIKWIIDKIKNDLENHAPATAQKNINLGTLDDVEFDCPPLEEQQEIVRRVEKLFSLADSLEQKYSNALKRVEKIEQAVLAKAFRGELVEPDPDDEPAEEMLKRILEEKAKLGGGGKNKDKNTQTINNSIGDI